MGTVAASADPDGDSLAYSLGGADGALFEVSSAGRVTVKAGTSLDFESRSSYSVTVQVRDNKDADGNADTEVDDTRAVTITVTNVNELPPRPTAVSVSGLSPTSVKVAWTAPQVPTGVPAVTGYALQYRKAGQTPPAQWTSWTHSGTGVEATITDLEASTEYEVQVNATNADGTGAWSDAASGSTQTPSTSLILSVDPSSIDEEAAGDDPGNGVTSVSVRVTATLDGGTRAEAVSVTLSVGDASTAERGAGKDYTAPAALGDSGAGSVDITIPAGSTSGSVTFAIDPVDDSLDEGDSETIVIVGEASAATSPARTAISVSSVILSIDDSTDAASTAVALSVDTDPGAGTSITIAENAAGDADGNVVVAVTATLSGSVAYDEDTVVALSLGGTAMSEDYTHTGPGSVTIPAGNLSGTASFKVNPTDDKVTETGGETIVVNGALSGFTVSPAMVTITDDDSPSTSLTLSVSPSSIDEEAAGDAEGKVSVEVTATLDGGTRSEAVTVTLSVGSSSTASRGTDYTADAELGDSGAGSVDITIAAGSASGSATFKFDPVDDSVDEGSGETVVIEGAASAATTPTVTSISVASATLTIDDSTDAASSTISLGVAPSTIAEDASGDVDGNVEVTVTATLSGSIARSTATVVALSLGGTATSADYTHTALSSVTIPARATSGSVTFKVDPTDDSVTETGGETITVNGALSGFTVSLATITISDDDSPSTSLTLSVDPSSIDEEAAGDDPGNGVTSVSVSVTATLDGGTRAENVTVTLSVGSASTATRGTDYSAPATLGDATVGHHHPRRRPRGVGDAGVRPPGRQRGRGRRRDGADHRHGVSGGPRHRLRSASMTRR